MSKYNIPFLLLAGGFGTRLGAITRHTPKPLMKIGGVNFIDYVVDTLPKDSDNIYIATHYKNNKFIEYANNKNNITIIKENEKLGTGGAIKNFFINYPKYKECIVLNADTYARIDYNILINKYKSRKVDCILVIGKNPGGSRYGNVEIINNKIISLEKNDKVISKLIYYGIAIYKKKEIMNIKSNKFSIENTYLKDIQFVNSSYHITKSPFFDIGVSNSIKDFKKYKCISK